jgi:hypothetical protein
MRASPSASVSFASTPGAATTSVVPDAPAYASGTGTGVAFVTVILTVAAVLRRPLGRYRNESVPT